MGLPRRLCLLLGVLIAALHLELVLIACPLEVVFDDRPYGLADYNTHFQQTHTVGLALERFGRTWAYDPNLLAGVPAGLFFDVDNKAHALLTYALTRLGLSQPAAFNLFTPLSCLLAPFSLLLAARLLRLGRGAQLAALGLGVLLWHFDSGLRYFWASGMVSFSTVAHGSVVALALHWRMLEERRLRFFVPLALLLPLLLLVHVWAFAICAVPMAGLYIARARRLPLWGHLQVWLVVVVAVLANGFWLLPALGRLELLAPAAVLGQANPLYFIADYLGLTRLPGRTEFIFLHTFFRFAALFFAVLTLWGWRRQRDGRYFYGTLSLGWLLGLAYLGAWVPGLRATEPYRFIAPAMLLCAALAGPTLSDFFFHRPWRTMSRWSRIALVVLLLLVVPRAVREVLYFLPELSPPAYLGAGDAAEAGKPHIPPPPPRGGGPFRLTPVPTEFYQVADFLERHCRQGRVLVREWTLAEFLRWATHRPIVGGFGERRTIHEAAHLFRRLNDPRLLGTQLGRYLERYSIQCVVVGGPPDPHLELRPDLFRLKKIVGGRRIHEALVPPSYFARGSGRLARAELNRIEVASARPAPGTEALVLRFHHLRGLRCRPGCRVEHEPVPMDPAGFIRVVGQPRLPSAFVVELVY